MIVRVSSVLHLWLILKTTGWTWPLTFRLWWRHLFSSNQNPWVYHIEIWALNWRTDGYITCKWMPCSLCIAH